MWYSTIGKEIEPGSNFDLVLTFYFVWTWLTVLLWIDIGPTYQRMSSNIKVADKCTVGLCDKGICKLWRYSRFKSKFIIFEVLFVFRKYRAKNPLKGHQGGTNPMRDYKQDYEALKHEKTSDHSVPVMKGYTS